MRSIAEIPFDQLLRKSFHPSPLAWEDEVLYFLMLDRFSDGKEKGYLDNDAQLVTTGRTPAFTPDDRGNATASEQDRQQWIEAGGRFVGGTLNGLESKIGYLSRLGITAIWISPLFRQVAFEETYHGYGIQNFLDVDPRFGTREDLVSLVQTAHKFGIRVILDIILNHSGNVFRYAREDMRCAWHDHEGRPHPFACWQADGHRYRVQGWNDAEGNPSVPFGPAVADSGFPDEAIWPKEFQTPEAFTRKGQIKNWDYDPEFREGDFFSLKDLHLGGGSVEHYRPSETLMFLCEVYKFWIALADLDGFRVDTVKHMDDGASRLFTSVIHEFAESLGKENFYLIAEITGGRENAVRTLEQIGMNAALGINEIPDKLEYMIKGYRNPEEYFNLFRNSLLVQKNSHVWFHNRVVTSFDDHDQVRKGNNKARFSHGPAGQQHNHKLTLNVLAVNVCTMGIPCIYYGSEQCFDGHGNNDRFIREAMFGGDFGPFESRNRHCFNEESWVYQEFAKIMALRKANLTIRRGRQYLRKISGNGIDFGVPRMIGGQIRSVVAWSRLHNKKEVLLAFNTDSENARTAWVAVEDGLHVAGEHMTCLYSTDPDQINKTLEVDPRQGAAVFLTVPAAGFVVYEKV